jgi:hypothetical protein
MRIAFALAGLAFAVVATGACEEPYKQTDAMTCMVYLALHSTTVGEGQAEGDAAALGAAAAAYRVLAEQKFGLDEAAQYLASSVVAYDEVDALEVATIARRCAAEAGVIDA